MRHGHISFPMTRVLHWTLALEVAVDANWLASKGWDVVAVEPCSEFRQLAEQESHGNVIWLDDELPELKTLRTAGHRF